MANITEIEGIGPVYGQKLSDVGIRTVEALLEAGASPQGRKTLAESTGIDAALLLKWVNRADLARLKGVGEEFADLLEAPGWTQCPSWPSATLPTSTKS